MLVVLGFNSGPRFMLYHIKALSFFLLRSFPIKLVGGVVQWLEPLPRLHPAPSTHLLAQTLRHTGEVQHGRVGRKEAV